MKVLYIFILFLLSCNVVAQKSAVIPIDEVQVYSHFSPNYHVGYSISTITDSVLKKENYKLSELLQKYSNVYIKEQGSGMLASISMRGSGAAHTAVYWNGIPINSALNGQTDFNTIFTSLYNKISIRKGGGSVLLGSGAIGGAINLENEIQFQNKITGLLSTSLGSYQSYATSFALNHSTPVVAFQMGFNGFSSKNNYEYSNSELKNENGEIKHYTLHLNAGYKLNNKNSLYVKGLYNNSDRNTSGTLFMTSNANLTYQTQKLLLGYKMKGERLKSELKTAYLKEDYKYIFSSEVPDLYSDNGSLKWFNNYNTIYSLNSGIQLQGGLTYELLFGKGTSIEHSDRQKLALYTSLHHKVSKKLQYNFSVRKEWTDIYEIPIVFSFDTKQIWHKQHSTSFNFSTNYRIPTLNDLYWKPGGNLDLIPEKNWSAELGYEWKTPHFQLGITPYISNSSNLIQWRPVNSFIWQPFNIQKVKTVGLEFDFNSTIKFGQNQFNGQLQYSYTNSKDDSIGKQLIYVPYHLGNLTFTLDFDNWEVSLTEKFTGKAYSTTTNTDSIDNYWLMNVGVKRNLFRQKMTIGFDINNLFSRDYQIVSSRPMPKRNFNLLINYKF